MAATGRTGPGRVPAAGGEGIWWTPLQLARRCAAMSRQAVHEAIGATAREGDFLAAVERPGHRLGQGVILRQVERDQRALARRLGWLLKGSRVDADA